MSAAAARDRAAARLTVVCPLHDPDFRPALPARWIKHERAPSCFVVSVACARRVFDCDFEKAMTMVVLGYVIGIGIWIIIGVWVLEHLIL